MHPDLSHLMSLPTADKLWVVEQLWDAIGEENFPLPDWHRQEAINRLAELDADPNLAITRDEFWRRVKSRDG